MRWMRGVFVGKLDRTELFLLLTPTGAMKTRCVRRLEGDNAWNLLFLNLCVVSPWNATARSTQQLQDTQVVLESGSTQRSAEQELNKKWWTRVMQLKLRLVQKLWKSQMRESEQGSSANESSLAGCIAAVNNLLCDVPTVDLSRDHTALSGKFPEDELKAGRELELQNMLNF